MKVEIPQILWHNTSNDNKNAPLLSLSLLPLDENNNQSCILATSGSTPDVHVWKLTFCSSDKIKSKSMDILIKGSKSEQSTTIEHLLTLERFDRAVNTLSFSPDGNYLGGAGDSGSIILWSSKDHPQRQKKQPLYQSFLSKESSALACQIPISQISGDIMDFSWCPSSRRFVVGSMDHTFSVFESTDGGTKWENVYRARDHLSYVQGVSWDPLGVYLASMGSDKTVRVYTRKQSKKKGVLAYSDAVNTTSETKPDTAANMPDPKIDNADANFLDSKFEMGKSRILKYYVTLNKEKRLLFADESSVESFFRRLNWSTDGAFLIAPAAMWKDSQGKPSFATVLFARHRFDQPYAVLSGFDQPCIAVKPCPVMFLSPNVVEKENAATMTNYRSVFAVLTADSVFIYDTFHWGKPLAVAKGLHYSSLTDCAWSRDGRRLLVTSSDGYISFLSFENGELGKPYIPNIIKNIVKTTSPISPLVEQTPLLPPCPPGQTAVLESPPMKKIKLSNNYPTQKNDTLIPNTAREVPPTQKDGVVNGITALSLQDRVKKKKRRVQPTLISS